MGFEEEFERVYNLKKFDGIDEMNEFCGKWHGVATVDHIPNFMRLYYDDVSTSEQNEFVTNVLNEILIADPEKAIEKIVENFNILLEEDAEDCFLYLEAMLVFWNPGQIPLSAKVIAKAEKSVGETFVAHIKKTVEKTKVDSIETIAEKFLSLYFKEKAEI